MFPFEGPHCCDAAVKAKHEAIRIEKRILMVTINLMGRGRRETRRAIKSYN